MEERTPMASDLAQMKIVYDIPATAQACREARAAISHHRSVYIDPHGRKQLCVRTFDPDRDVLYFRDWDEVYAARPYLLNDCVDIAVQYEAIVCEPQRVYQQIGCPGALGPFFVVDEPSLDRSDGCREIRNRCAGVWRYDDHKEDLVYTAGSREGALMHEDAERRWTKRMASIVQDYSIFWRWLRKEFEDLEIRQLVVCPQPSQERKRLSEGPE